MNLYSKLIIVCFVLLTSCASKKDLVYFQNSGSITSGNPMLYETRFQPDDLLLINVSSKDSESAAPFNLGMVPTPSVMGSSVAQQQQQFHLVNKEGNVDFPVLGLIKFGGKTREEVVKLLKEKLSLYLQDPILNIRIMNFKISVLGEVNKPGAYSITSERLSIIEALSLAGDLTIYGKRNNVVIVREIDGKKESKIIDLTKADFISSEFYYLKQNDVVYVEPNKTKVNSSAVGANTSVIISAISLLLTVVALVIK